jgi:trehalose synthase
LQKIKTRPVSFRQYQDFISKDLYEQIVVLAKGLRGLSTVYVNATAKGGGVAEILGGLVPLLNDLGIETSWYVIEAPDQFFQVTKFLHNALQGKRGNLTSSQKRIYLNCSQKIAREMAKIDGDIWVIHDPQPLATIKYLNGAIKPAVWRCHLDLSQPNKSVWHFLSQFVCQYDRFVFTLPSYIPADLPKEKVFTSYPTIDPLSDKNRFMTQAEAKKLISVFGIDTNRPLISQISRFDPWKDPLGVIEAYRFAKKKIPKLQLALVGEIASDDPEGEKIYKIALREVAADPDIYLLVLPHSNLVINAFQTGSDVIIQKSIREGFGLTVTEAMWKGKAVIGGNVGGIRMQIDDGKNGFLVESPKECAEKIVKLIRSQELREKLGQEAREKVKENFLLPHKVFKWLLIFHDLALEAQHKRGEKAVQKKYFP